MYRKRENRMRKLLREPARTLSANFRSTQIFRQRQAAENVHVHCQPQFH